MVEIKAGAELDRAVAEAAGYDATIYYSHDLEKNVCLLLPSEESFSPSVDLNYAFAAAERAGVFLELNCLSDGWMATTHAMRGKSPAVESTPALAICAVILEVASGTPRAELGISRRLAATLDTT